MVRRVKSACRLCGGEVEQRNMLTKRGYHEQCAPAAAAIAARQLADRNGPMVERQLIKTMIEAQLELRRVRARRLDRQVREP